jgi:hypothetical protein
LNVVRRYKWVALRPPTLLNGEMHLRINWTEDGPRTKSPKRSRVNTADRDRRLSAMRPSRGLMQVCDLQARNIKTNDMGRKIYVVVKLCVEFPSPDNAQEMQLHVESSFSTTLQVSGLGG